MNPISVTELGPRRTIASGRHLLPHEVVRPSFEGQDPAALARSLPNPETTAQPRLDLITIPGGYMQFGEGRDGVAATAEGRPIAETAWFADGGHPSLETLRATARDVDEDWVAVVDNGWDNYFHTLVLVMPKIHLARIHVPDAVAALPAYRRLNPGGGGQPPALDQLLALGAFGDGVRLVEDGLYRLRNLHLIWPNDPEQAYLLLADDVYSAFPALARRVSVEAAPSPSRRIFIQRMREPRIPDPDAVRILDRHLDRHGFERVRLEALSVADQIRLFARATHVVAAHGAGLSNIVFADPGLRVLELNLELDGAGRLRPWFLILARHKRHHYQYLDASAGESTEATIGAAFDRLMQGSGPLRPARFRAWLKTASSWLRGRTAAG